MDELIFKYSEVRLQADHPVAALNQSASAFILLRNGYGQWVLGAKTKYAVVGISRLLGGHIKAGEDPQQAAQRELLEEAGVDVELDRLIPLVHVDVFEREADDDPSFSAFVFYCQTGDSLRAGSDVSSLVALSDHDYTRLVEKLRQLPEESKEPSDVATWADYGQVMAPIHQAAMERVKELGL